MTGTFIRPLVASGVAAALLIFSVPASAGQHYLTAKVSVDTSGLNLATPQGARQLDRRIDAAIRTMCGPTVFGTRDEADALDACRSEARTAVEPQMRKMIADATVTVAAN